MSSLRSDKSDSSPPTRGRGFLRQLIKGLGYALVNHNFLTAVRIKDLLEW